jgi:hypothetical protein
MDEVRTHYAGRFVQPARACTTRRGLGGVGGVDGSTGALAPARRASGISGDRPGPAGSSGPTTSLAGKLSLRYGASSFNPISSLSFHVTATSCRTSLAWPQTLRCAVLYTP